MRKCSIGLIGVLLSSCAYGAAVTYTLSLNENAAGQCAANSFVIYGSVSQGDNLGFHSFSVDLMTSSQGGAALTSYINRSPNGTWDADPNDPNYNPEAIYPTKYGGFNAGRSASASTGQASGAYDGVKGEDAIRIYGFGQRIGNMNEYHPPPASVEPDFKPVAYKAYAPSAGSDVAYGTTRQDLPAGSLRLASGAWTGAIAPSIDVFSLDNKAFLWKDTSGDTLIVFPQFRTVDFCAVVPEPSSSIVMIIASLRILRRVRRAQV